MNLLMTIAVIGAIAIGEWFEAATVAFLFGLSLTLEAWSVARARRAVEALLDLAPALARIRTSGGELVEVPAGEVAIGATMVVKPGERVPLDGRVVAGKSGVNQAPITGESAPAWKESGSEVFAGTINGDGALEIETTRRADDTTLAHIIRLVEDAQSRRAPAEQWVEKFARYYTPAVMALAVAIALAPPLLLGQAWAPWIYRALVLLVIACPCALVISTPVSIVAGLAAAASHGVLIKGGLYLELPARVRAIALDKTGTLTRGHPTVVDVVPLDNHDESGLLETAAALEARSEHPLARAILTHAEKRGVPIGAAEDFRILRGRGAEGRVKGRDYWVGSHRLLEERGQETPELHDRLERMAAQARTGIVVGSGDHV
jgi:Cd2+/Zn2+-exporting ATPase